MLRLKLTAGQLSAARRGSVRALSMTNVRRQEQPKTAKIREDIKETIEEFKTEEEPGKKKSHKFRNFLLFTTSVGAVAYGGGVWYATKNDQFHDLFTEYVPFSEDVVAWVEERLFRQQIRGGLTLPEFKPPSKTDNKIQITKGGAGATEIDQVPETLPHVSALNPKQADAPKKIESPVKVTKKKEEEKQPVPAAAPQPAQPATNNLPLVHLPSDSDPLVAGAVDSLNQLISGVNSANTSEGTVKTLAKELTKLSEAVHALRSTHQEQLQRQLEDQAKRFSSLGEARTKELQKTINEQQEHLADQFHAEHQRLLELYNNRLVTEIEATKKAVIAKANNKLLAVNAEREKQFAERVAQLVETEREGRLGKIEELSESVKAMEELSLAADKIIRASESNSKLQSALTSLTHTLSTSTTPIPLGQLLKVVKDAAPDNELISAALQAIPESAWRQGVLSPAQLAARLRLIEPEIRKASLLPPNAGIAGHLGSWAFSHLLWKKNGNPVGDDIESILARAQNALGEGRVTDAVSEINQLHGWPKRLAHDWLTEGRKRSEVDFLVNLLSEEGKLQGSR